jgi:hypothetical protein
MLRDVPAQDPPIHQLVKEKIEAGVCAEPQLQEDRDTSHRPSQI